MLAALPLAHDLPYCQKQPMIDVYFEAMTEPHWLLSHVCAGTMRCLGEALALDSSD